MKVRIRLFGAFRKYGDGSELELELSEGAKLGELRSVLRAELSRLHPGFADEGLIGESAFASGSAILNDAEKITPGAELAVLPPVCGG